jgi:hypothetical protein
MRDLQSSAPHFLVEAEADCTLLQELGASVSLIERGIAGLAGNDNIVLVARGNGREQLAGMNLASTGRFVDLRAPLPEVIGDHPDPLGLLDQMAHDVCWAEERPACDWPNPGPPVQGLSSGLQFLDPFLRWLVAELVILVGPYGCGKSSLARLLAYLWADLIGRKVGKRASILAMEDSFPTVKREISRFALGGDFAEYDSAQARRVLDMERRIGWVQRDLSEDRRIDWLCSIIEHRARHDNVGFFVVDPWNELDFAQPRDQTETQHMRELMTRFRRLSHSLQVVILIVTHLSARSYDEHGGIKPFRVANAAGSVQYGNKCDRGICVLRTSALAQSSSLGTEEHMLLRFDKAKSEETQGRRGTVACVFDPKHMTLSKDAGATEEARKQWQ